MSTTPTGPVCDAKALERMNVPPALWAVHFDGLNTPLKKPIANYFANLDSMMSRGAGMFFYGPAGLGKTSAGIVMLKAAWERRKTGLFVTVKDLRQSIREDITFDGSQSMLERAKNVDLLVLDDLAKDDLKNFQLGIAEIEHLLRSRSMRGKASVFTTRLTGEDFRADAPTFLPSLQGSFVGLLVTGENQKAVADKKLRSLLGVA